MCACNIRFQLNVHIILTTVMTWECSLWTNQATRQDRKVRSNYTRLKIIDTLEDSGICRIYVSII